MRLLEHEVTEGEATLLEKIFSGVAFMPARDLNPGEKKVADTLVTKGLLELRELKGDQKTGPCYIMPSPVIGAYHSARQRPV